MPAEPPITRTNLHDPQEFASVFMDELRYGQGVALTRSSLNDKYFALAHTVRRALMARWLDTLTTQMAAGKRAVAYLSAEYLLGRQLEREGCVLLDLPEGPGHGPGLSRPRDRRRRPRHTPPRQSPRTIRNRRNASCGVADPCD